MRVHSLETAEDCPRCAAQPSARSGQRLRLLKVFVSSDRVRDSITKRRESFRRVRSTQYSIEYRGKYFSPTARPPGVPPSLPTTEARASTKLEDRRSFLIRHPRPTARSLITPASQTQQKVVSRNFITTRPQRMAPLRSTVVTDRVTISVESLCSGTPPRPAMAYLSIMGVRLCPVPRRSLTTQAPATVPSRITARLRAVLVLTTSSTKACARASLREVRKSDAPDFQSGRTRQRDVFRRRYRVLLRGKI